MTSSPHDQSTIRPPHPLAVELGRRLAQKSRILDYCSGSGRNAAYLRSAGFDVVEVADADAPEFDCSAASVQFAGAVTSHGLLHGYASSMPARTASLAGRLEPLGWMFATFGSHRDARYGVGLRLGGSTFAAQTGDESGVPHAYFDETSLRAILDVHFEIEMLEERDAAQTAGGWAHSTPLSHAVHWFFGGRRRERFAR